jgi:hypothetical protein
MQMPRGHVRRHVSTKSATAAIRSHSTSSSSSTSASNSPAAAAVRQPHSTAAAVKGSCAVDSDEALDSLALLQHIEQQSAEVRVC